MSTSLLSTTRFRIIFGICWFSLIQVQAIVLNHYGFSWRTALLDSATSYTLLCAFALLISVTLQFYIPQKSRYTYLLALVLVLTTAWFLISKFLLFAVVDDLHYKTFYNGSLVVRIAFAFLLLGFMALLSVLYYTLQDQQETEKRKAEAEALSKNAELNSLRQQLQPHFLFNSLNSINALITSQPQQARKMVQQLSDFLRGTLSKDAKQTISFREELQHLQLYLDIEKVRFGHRLTTTVENNAPTKMMVPALLLQPLVENAIKFGLYGTTGDIVISIEAREVDKNLQVTIINPFDAETAVPQKGTGFGLHAVNRRLYLLFGRTDLVQTEVNADRFITKLKIPQP